MSVNHNHRLFEMCLLAMRVTITLFVFFFICSVQLSVASEPSGQDTFTLRSASELSYPPFAVVTADGEADGFSVELLKAVTNAVNLDIQFEVGPWHIIKNQLSEGTIDVLPLVSYSVERDKYFDFTAPYLRLHGTIFVRKENVSIHDEKDLAGKEVLVMKGDTAHEYLIKNETTDKLILTKSFKEAFLLLSQGKHDAVVVQRLAGLQLLKQLKLKNIKEVGAAIPEIDLKPASHFLKGFEQNFCIAVKEGNDELLAKLNEGLTIVITDGTYNDLYHKWFGPILPQNGINIKDVIKVSLYIFLPLLAFLFFVTSLLLKREIRKKTFELKQEIEERKQVERVLKERESTLNTIHYNVPVGMAILDSKSRFHWPNKQLSAITGYSIEELEGLPSKRLYVSEGEYYRVLTLKKKNIEREGFSEIETVWSKKSGEEINVIIKATFLNSRNIEDGFINTIRDVTESKNIEKRLQQAGKMEAIGTLAGGIAHDFNNILAAILGYGQMAKEELAPNHPLRKHLEQIVSAGERAADLVKQILTFSRQDQEDIYPVELNSIVKEVVKLLRSTIPTTIEITSYICSDKCTVRANPTQIHQVLMNLCTNAGHALENSDGAIIVTLEKTKVERTILSCDGTLHPAGHYVKLSVRDNGKGMPAAIQSKIFDPFFSTKSKDQGTGLGLSVTLGVVQNVNGALTLDSKLNQGSTFCIYIPEHSEEEKRGQPVENNINLGGTEHILVVDDEAMLVEMLEQSLKNYGYRVTTFTSCQQALDFYYQQHSSLDVVVSDMTMPGMNGLEFFDKILSFSPEQKTILCTGYSEAVNKDITMAHGITAFAYKPLAGKQLAEKIREILD